MKKFNTHNLPKVTLREFLEKYLTEDEVTEIKNIQELRKQEELSEIEELKLMVQECMMILKHDDFKEIK